MINISNFKPGQRVRSYLDGADADEDPYLGTIYAVDIYSNGSQSFGNLGAVHILRDDKKEGNGKDGTWICYITTHTKELHLQLVEQDWDNPNNN